LILFKEVQHMHRTSISKDDRSPSSVGGASAPVSSLLKRPPPGSSILSFQADRRRYQGLEEASSPVEGFEPIGLLAVRLLARFTLPRMRLLPPSREGDDGSAR
jgi:hypothetical protein